jgi:predicted permease
MFLRPLPYPNADRIVMVGLSGAGGQRTELRPLYPPTLFSELEERADVFEDIAAYVAGSNIGFDLAGGSASDRVPGAVVSRNFFRVIGARARIGRTFAEVEEPSIADREVVISEGLWRRLFNAEEQVISTAVSLNGLSYTVIGVVGAEVDFPRNVELWVTDPLRAEEAMNTTLAVTYSVEAVGHLHPGIDGGVAESTLNSGRMDDNSFQIVALREHLFGNTRPVLVLVWATSLFLLLITCANVAGLAISRTAARRFELAIRAGLGASRWRLMRLVMTESLLLAGAGAVLGLVLSYWLASYVIDFGSGKLGDVVKPTFDWRVLLGTVLLSLVTGILFGFVPSLAASRRNIVNALREGSRSATGSRAQRHILRLLATSEVALALLLLIGAGLMSKTFIQLTTLDFGYEIDRVLTLRVNLPSWKYPDRQQLNVFYESVSDRIKTSPGVEYSGWTTSLPVGGSEFKVLFLIEGKSVARIEESPSTYVSGVTGDYFQAMGISLTEGRYFNAMDTKDAALVAIIDRTMARRFWPDDSQVVGTRLNWQGKWREIVGVVGEVRSAGPDGQVRPQLYVPYSQFEFPWPSMYLAARAATSTRDVSVIARAAISQQDSDQPVTNVLTVRELISSAVERQSFGALLMGVFAGLSLALSALGVYGVVVYSVRQRVREIGIRVSLGASPRSVLRLIMSQGVLMVGIGLIFGLVSAILLTRLLAGFLYGVSPTDPSVFGAATIVVFVAAIAACYVPARRASRVDPMIVLKAE